PHNLTESGKTIAATIKHAVENGHREIEVTADAEKAWVDLLLTGGGRMLGSPDCTPGYYNNEGQDPGPAAAMFVGYPAGASAFFAFIDQWRSSGKFEGLEFR
ncbi:MAG: monooxygenase, partial [Acidimicrobiales bacterium]